MDNHDVGTERSIEFKIGQFERCVDGLDMKRKVDTPSVSTLGIIHSVRYQPGLAKGWFGNPADETVMSVGDV